MKLFLHEQGSYIYSSGMGAYLHKETDMMDVLVAKEDPRLLSRFYFFALCADRLELVDSSTLQKPGSQEAFRILQSDISYYCILYDQVANGNVDQVFSW